jgi:outer membrane protein OmpA-like peptidoglycan-associated protein
MTCAITGTVLERHNIKRQHKQINAAVPIMTTQQFFNNQKPIAMVKHFIIAAATFVAMAAHAQTTFTGQVTDRQTGLALPNSNVVVFDDMLKKQIALTTTDATGRYTVAAPKAARYALRADKSTYFYQDTVVPVAEGTAVVNLGLATKPGYQFNMTIFDKAYEHNPINTLKDCKVEIYNNTTKEQELFVEKLEKSTFHFAFLEGNHYTMLVRKPGYLNRRVELYVNVNGCILCVDGMGIKEPDLVPLMSNDNQTGHMLGTIDLDSIQVGKRFQLNNIYYDFDKWDLRPEAAKTLDKLAVFLKDNANIKVELGSHTDARGADAYNLDLSDKRAKAAVTYLTSVQGLDPERITHKGYGETVLINRCDDGAPCSEAEHQLNRRTEIKITGVADTDPLWNKTLKQIIEDPSLYRRAIEQEKREKSAASKGK